jgi:predicted membrane GTPase involved in stress response
MYCKSKKLTNFRSNAEVMTVLNTKVDLSLEQFWILLKMMNYYEATPQNLRLTQTLFE